MDTQDLQKLKNKFDIIGNDPALNAALEMAVEVAGTDLTVMITGESGSGKDVIPRIIHQNSLRRTGKFLPVNCAAIPEGTVDAELFGHEKGSFTGAVSDRRGYFEEADGGTIFLDEIGELPLSTQAKLLRVLQSGEFIRVGASKVSKTNVRVIAATNVNLLHAVAKGKFRQDLYYRLCAINITIPPLRERKEDIYLLFRKFTSDFSERYSRRKVSLTRDAVLLLTSYRWPGNVRELQSIANRVSVFESAAAAPGADRIEIDASTLSKYISMDNGDELLPVTVGQGPAESLSDNDKQEILRAIAILNSEVTRLRGMVESREMTALPLKEDRRGEDIDEQDIRDSEPEDETLNLQKAGEDMIRKVLEKYDGNRKKAARELGISERTLYRKLPPEFRTVKSK